MSALDPVYIHQIADLLAERVPEMPEATSHLIGLCLKELLQNVFEHAPEMPGGPVLCFVHSRWYLRERNVRLAVVDGGIGIPAALRRGKVRGLQRASDTDVVIAAVAEQGLSSGRGRRGLGLKLIRDIVTARDGALTVISGTAKVKFKTRGRIMRGRKLQQNFRGTAIEIDFRPGKQVPLSSEPVVEVF
jgi:two-component sensor histidine kinase